MAVPLLKVVPIIANMVTPDAITNVIQHKLDEMSKDNDLIRDMQRQDHQIAADAKARKINAEIDEMLADAEFRRREKLVQAVERYQKEMSEAAISMGESIGRMTLELRERAYALIDERNKDYIALQDEASKKASDQLENLEKRFPNGGRAREIMETAIEKQLIGIIETAQDFVKDMENDLKQMNSNIDQITRETINSVTNDLSPMMARATAGRLSSEENHKMIK